MEEIISSNRNHDYGVKTWKDLGLRGIFVLLYTKYQRTISILEYENKLDSFVDTYGYCVLAAIYLKGFGVDFSKIEHDKTYESYGLGPMLKFFWLQDTIEVNDAAQLLVNYLYMAARYTFMANPKNIIPLNSRS